MSDGFDSWFARQPKDVIHPVTLRAAWKAAIAQSAQVRKQLEEELKDEQEIFADTNKALNHVTDELAEKQRTIDALLVSNGELEAQVKKYESMYPVAYMYPSDLDKFQEQETFAQAFSVKVGCPDEVSVPLYAHPDNAKEE